MNIEVTKIEEPKAFEFQDILYIKFHCGELNRAIPIAKFMEALVRRQASEGFSCGYLGHGVRYTKYGPRIDRMLVDYLFELDYDMEDIYQFMNSTWGRHMGDALEESACKASWRKIFDRDISARASRMFESWGTAKDTKSPWSGARVTIRR